MLDRSHKNSDLFLVKSEVAKLIILLYTKRTEEE